MAKNPWQEKADHTARSRGDDLGPLHPHEQRREQGPGAGPVQLEAVLEAMDQGLIVTDLAGNVLRMNRRALELHDLDCPSEALRTLKEYADLFELSAPDGTPVAPADCPLARAARGQTFSDWQLHVRDKRTGREWIGSYGGNSVPDASGRTVLGVVTVRDVTEQKRVESQLRETNRRLNETLAVAKADVWSIDLATDEITASQELLARYGFAAGKPLHYETALDAVHPEDRPHVRETLRRALQEKGTYRAEFRAMQSDGSMRWLATQGRVIDYDGTPRLHGLIHDITEQRHAEELRHRTEQRLRGFFESSGVYMTLLETMEDDILCVLANGKVAEFFGRPLEQVTGATGRELGLSEEVVSHWLALLGQCRESGQPTSVEYALPVDAGDQWFSGTVTPLGAGESGRPQFALVATDATERRQAEQALRESEALYRTLATKLPGGAAFILDRDLRYVVAEGQALETAGFTPKDFEGKTIWEALDAETAGQYEESFKQALEGSRFRWEHESHGRQYVSEGVPIADAQGGVTHVLAISYDITDRKRMEQELRQLNQRLEEEVQAQTQELQEMIDRLRGEADQRALVEGRLHKRSQMLDAFFRHSATPLAFLDREFNFVRVNQAYAGAHGAVAGEFTERNYFEMHPHEETRKIFEQVVRTGEPYRAVARPVIDPADPQHVTFWDWQIQPLKDDKGCVELLVFNLQDVTAQQTAMHELRRRTAQLQRLALELTQAEDRERKQLARLLHDDLQQQLAAAKFHLGLLSSRTKDDAGLQEIAAQLASLLRDAMDKSRTLSHELSPAVLHQHDVGEIFEWVGRQFQIRHGLTVHVEVRGQVQSQSEPLKAFLLRSAQEILFNTIKHASVGQARLRVQRRRGCIWLTIGDRGGGFDPNQIDMTGGYGLMSIRERAELLGGRMRIRSAPGRGSTFVITMPDVEVVEVGDEQPEPPAGKPKKRQGRRRKRRRTTGGPIHVLLVDDHKIMRDGLANLLSEESDIEIVGHAANGSEAIERARELLPDVIIMDVAMPVMAGDEASRHIRREMPHVRIVALSMFEEPGLAQMMKEAGADAYLAKSGPFQELIAAVRGELPE